MFFASDNTAPVHPKIMEALVAANAGYVGSYGAEDMADALRDRIRDLLHAPRAEVVLVTTGTAANALGLALITPPWGAIYAHNNAHIEEDEANAPAFFSHGATMRLIPGVAGKITADCLRAALRGVAAGQEGSVHNAQPASLSITNLSELGHSYRADDIDALAAIAHAAGLKVHVDGARLANALSATGDTAAQMLRSVDVVSFGATKNGAMGVEAMVLIDPTPGQRIELERRRKRAGHLMSKHRYLSAQMMAYLADDLWLELAQAANGMAAGLAEKLGGLVGVSIEAAPDGNLVFATVPRGRVAAARAKGARFLDIPDDMTPDGPADALIRMRFVASWCTTLADVDAMVAALKP